MRMSLLTAGKDPPYVLPFAAIMASKGVRVDLIGGDAMQDSEVVRSGQVQYHNLRGEHGGPFHKKALRVLRYYWRLVNYAIGTDSELFHIQWFYKFVYFERTLLSLVYKVLGKKLIFTAHNVNAGIRDGNDTLLNRLSLKILYRLVDHIFVHTTKMQRELLDGFDVPAEKVTVIPFGINNTVPTTDLGRSCARQRLGLESEEKVALFFGNIVPYKGLEHLIVALALLRDRGERIRLVVAGRISDCPAYWSSIKTRIEQHGIGEQIIERLDFIPDEEIEVYLKASDLMVLPYNHIFQSGVLFLAYGFGVPVVATDVGSLSEDVVEGETGFLCRPEDPEDLARKIEAYFRSPLYRDRDLHRQRIAAETNRKHSWDEVGKLTLGVYDKLLSRS